MKFKRKDLEWFLFNIRQKAKMDKTKLTDKDLIHELANYMEANPSCANLDAPSHPGRFSYSTVGYGVFSLLGEKYRMGRIEVFDSKDESGYQVHEGFYCMPHTAASQFEDFIDSLETDLPIHFDIGSVDWCKEECAKSLGFSDVKEMQDTEKIKEYQKKKNDKYAQEEGYKDWEDLLAHSKWAKPKESNE